MRSFAEAYRSGAIVQQAVGQLGSRSHAAEAGKELASSIVQQPVRQLPEPIEPQAIAQFPVLPPEPMASLPKNLRGALPSIEELEKRLADDEPR